jgi:diguanylate cyclase (GGDEF)-like protein
MKVLIADDNPLTRRTVVGQVQEWGYEAVAAQDGNEAWRILQVDDPPLLAVLDWLMPGLDGLEVCRRLRRLEGRPSTYVIMLTARGETEDMVRAIDEGVDDFLTKPCSKQELRVRLRAGLRRIELEESLREQVAHDPVTDAFSRPVILELLDCELVRANWASTPTGLLLAGVDFPRRGSESAALQEGAVMKVFGQQVNGLLRPFDWLGRYGPRELLVVLPQCSAAEAETTAERLHQGIAGRPMETPAGAIPVNLHVGVAGIPPGAVAPEPFLQTVEKALARARQGSTS